MSAPVIQVQVCPMSKPSDVSGVRALLDSGAVDSREIVAVVGKTEGTGLHMDPGRELADLSLRQLFGERLAISPAAVAERICILLSGGVPGVLTPHVAIFTRSSVELSAENLPEERRLVLGVAHSADIAPEEIGRMGQVGAVAQAVRSAMADAEVTDPRDVHLVLVKAPALSLASIADAEARGETVVTKDLSIGAQGSICYANDASALGVASALGEVAEGALSDEVIRRDWSLYSEVAMCSSGGEKTHAEVLLLANRTGSASALRIGHGVLRDAIDAVGVKDALRSAGLEFGCCPTAEDLGRVVHMFAKLTIPGTDRLRGQRITLLDDHDGYAMAKAVGGTLVASVTGLTTAFVSGGERNSHQGPPDGNPVAALIRRSG